MAARSHPSSSSPSLVAVGRRSAPRFGVRSVVETAPRRTSPPTAARSAATTSTPTRPRSRPRWSARSPSTASRCPSARPCSCSPRRCRRASCATSPPGEGDRDSVGVLQQRPSQGWGGGQAAEPKPAPTSARRRKEFLDALVKVPDWQTMPLADAVQAVQISADGSAYAQHEPEATGAGRRAAGHDGRPAITCSFEKPTKVAAPATVAGQVAQRAAASTRRPPAGQHGAGARRQLADGGLVRRQRRPARHRAGRPTTAGSGRAPTAGSTPTASSGQPSIATHVRR